MYPEEWELPEPEDLPVVVGLMVTWFLFLGVIFLIAHCGSQVSIWDPR